MARFSNKLQTLVGDQPRSILTLISTFEDKSFAVLFLLLMAVPALPIPTGGITHVFEVIVILLALQLMIGRRSVWLPKKWLGLKLPGKFWSKTLPTLIKLIKKLEGISKPRMRGLISNQWFDRATGLVVLVLTLTAALAPPFSGLDTLPALGVVLISLGLILEDILVSIVGLIVGIIGIALVLVLGSFVFRLL